MATKQHICFTVSCDNCKDEYDESTGITMHYDSPEEAEDAAESYDWGKVSDGRFLCSSCIYGATQRGELEECEDSTHLDHAFHPVKPQGAEQS